MTWNLALAATLALSACTSSGLCKKGSEACRQKNNGTCDTGLVKMGDLCVRPGTGGAGGAGATGGTGGAGGMSGAGGTGADGGPPDKACAADTRPDACTKFCDAFCNNQTDLCVASRCKAGECAEGGELFDFCMNQCDSIECAQNLCMNEFDRTCENFAFHEDKDDDSSPYIPGCNSNDPKCVLFGEERCSDSCGTVLSSDVDPSGIDSFDNGVGGDLAKNGTCEDGGGTSTDLCPRGTDCTDCGPRECIAQGDKCTDPEDCCEYFSDGAFCVNLGTPASPDSRCLLSCTETERCPTSFRCTAVSNNVDKVCAPM